MASKNSWVIAWLDANFNESDDNRDTQKKLAPLCQTLRGFTNENECSAFIKSEPKKNIIVLVSGRLSRAIIPENHDKSQISAFFLYCMNIDPHKDWSKSFNKIKGIHTVQADLIEAIRQYQNQSKTDEKFDDESLNPVVAALSSLVVKEPEHILSGYEKLPLFSLVQTTDILSDFVPQISQMTSISMKNAKKDDPLLTQDQYAAIYLLSLDYNSKQESFSKILNNTLLSKNTERIRKWFPYLRLLFSGLAKLDNVKRAVHRVILQEAAESEKFSENNIILWEFLFCNLNVDDLNNQGEASVSKNRLLLTLQCLTAKDITKYAAGSLKGVAIIPPGTNFNVVSTLNAGSGLQLLQLQEIGSFFSIK